MHECRGQDAEAFVGELVVDAESVGRDVDHAAAYHEPRTEQLLAVMARVRVGGPELHGVTPAEGADERCGAGRRVHAVEADIHVTEVIDLVRRDGAGVRDREVRGRELSDAPILPEPVRARQAGPGSVRLRPTAG